MKHIISFLVTALCATVTYSQIIVTQLNNPNDLVQNVLLGPGVTVSNITFNGAPGNTFTTQMGKFVKNNSNIGLDSGIVIGTGDISIIDDGNISGSASLGGNGLSNDPDLNLLSNNTTEDLAILEFDFVPQGDTIRFRYVFASEEYNEYACSDFNDVFGFFISGPGITGPFSSNSKNIAIIPNTTTPVAINTVNLGIAGIFGDEFNCAAADVNWQNNAQYFVDNENGNTVEYDGFTVVLEAVSAVQCNQTYHLKIAIADAFDGSFDSGVFLEARSLKSSVVSISAVTTNNDTILVEGCNQATFLFERDDASDSLELQLSVTGSATMGTDFTNVPTTIVLPPGVFNDSLIVQAFTDNASEPFESLSISIVFDNGCELDSVTASLSIRNIDQITANAFEDTLICSAIGQIAPVYVEWEGGIEPYTFLWNSGETTDSIGVSPADDAFYFVTITDSCGNTGLSDTVFVTVQCPITVPNVFTPNGDGVNELFIIQNIEQYPDNEVWVYNRWGLLVLYRKNYQNDWTGDGLSEGTYFYVVDNKLDPVQNGFLMILRP